jgi:hypothetical protein
MDDVERVKVRLTAANVGMQHVKPYLSDIAVDTKDLEAATRVRESCRSAGSECALVYGASPMSEMEHCSSFFSTSSFDSTVRCNPCCNHYLCVVSSERDFM